MKKKEYVRPTIDVLSLYSDELMQAGFHAQSGIRGQLDPADEEEGSRRHESYWLLSLLMSI